MRLARFCGDRDGLLQVEHAVAPRLGDDHDVSRGLRAREGLEASALRSIHEVLHVGLYVVQDLLVAHHLVLRRVDKPLLRPVHQCVPIIQVTVDDVLKWKKGQYTTRCCESEPGR